MGVDFYTCATCEYNFPDCGPYFGCSCGEHFCSAKCGGKQLEPPPDEDKDWEEITTCVLCRLESATDRDMVNFLLKKLGLRYEEALEMYRQDNKNDETEG